MDKIKIILIDRTPSRRSEIWSSIQPFNQFSAGQACFSHIWADYDSKQMRNDWESKPDLFLLHINDQTYEGEPYCKYVERINQDLHEALIVLYSGGGIDVKAHTANQITAYQAGKPWDFNVTNGDQFCIIKRLVNSASDFNIVPALEKYTAGGTKEEFFNILLGAEESLEYLPALAILCQGYLAVHAEKQGDEWGPDDIKSALYQMGWPAFMESGEGTELLKTDLASQRGAVSSPGWWSDIFEGGKTELESGIARELGVDDIEDCPVLKSLVDAIYGTNLIERHLVADAYCAIVEKIGDKPCEQE